MPQFKHGDKVQLNRDIEFYSGTAIIGDEAIVWDATDNEVRILVARYGKTWVDNSDVRPMTTNTTTATEAADPMADAGEARTLMYRFLDTLTEKHMWNEVYAFRKVLVELYGKGGE